MKKTIALAFALLLTAVAAWGDGGGGEGNLPLTRAEVKEMKTLLSELVAALGPAPAGYSRLEEEFELPTECQAHPPGRFQPLYPAVRLKFGTDSAAAEKAAETAAKELQKKFMEANARGDVQAMLEYQQGIGGITAQMMGARLEEKEPIDIRLHTNRYGSTAIDPDGVLFEKAGVIALKAPETPGRVVIFFDPVALKQTETLARVELPYPEDGVPRKNTVENVVIEIEGPEAEVASWAAQVNTAAVLGRIR